MSSPSNWTTRARFRAVLAVSLLLCASGLAVAVLVTGNPDDGGRGGALAVALSFAILFLSRGYGTKVYDALTEEASAIRANLKALAGESPAEQGPTVEDKVDALVSKARIDAQTQEIQNFYLTWSSVVGTVTWGFGDIVAGALL